MVDLYGIIINWQQIGVFDIILPFILIFSISYGLFGKIKLFGDNTNKINILVSFVLALLFLQNDYLVVRLQSFLPEIAFAIVAILMGLLLISLFSGKAVGWGDKAGWIAIIISIIILVSALSKDPTQPYDQNTGILQWISDFWQGLEPNTQGLLIFILIIGILVLFLSGGSTSAGSKFFDALKDIFKGPGGSSGGGGGHT